MDDQLLGDLYPHKKGDILKCSKYPFKDQNEWKITKYLIGGYELVNLHTGEYMNVLDEEVDFAMPDLKKIFLHEGHEVIVTYVRDPHDHNDRYLYCRDCKKEIFSKYKKLPPPERIYFI